MLLRIACLPVLLLACCTAAAFAQSASAPTNHALFAPLPLPTPNAYRSASGRPGPAYWQQQADYRIRVALDPAEHRVTGSETITYTNQSPDSLDHLWLHLEQNKFAPGSRGELLFGSARFRGAFPEGGLDLGEMTVEHDGARYAPDVWIDGTRMRVDLRTPLAPEGGRLTLDLAWTFVVPEYGADRMGRYPAEAGIVYELAQWYPRLAVYDDVSGWNPLPYLGQGEFYLEFGTFDVEITVPREMIVVATGILLNPEDVFTPAQQARLDRARTSAETIAVVPAEEVGATNGRPAGDGPLTWRFRAERVRDFAWAASRAFLLDAAAWENVLVQAAYPAEGLGTPEAPGWEQAASYVRHAVEHYSARWLRYPYPAAISVGGRAEGMEYPMISFNPVYFRGDILFDVVDHEVAHTWFPHIVGSDERRYAWMDEGFTTFINQGSQQAFLPPVSPVHGQLDPVRAAGSMRHSLADQPLATAPDRIRPFALGFQAYVKPALGLSLLRDVVLGPERFDRAFRAYIERWAFRHPQPADFFRTIEDVSGEDLAWFWRGWFYSTATVDQAIDLAYTSGDATTVQVSTTGELLLPVHLRLTTADGGVEEFRLPVDIWLSGNTYQASIPSRSPVAAVEIDPDGRLPDINPANNRWQATESGE